MAQAVFGFPPYELAEVAQGAVQLSPLCPGGTALEELKDASLERAVVLAPGGTLERRYTLAQVLRALKPGGQLVALAHKKKGGSRLESELEQFGCQVAQDAQQHFKICQTTRPASPALEAALEEGAARQLEQGIWTQPGIFSWDRLDVGSALLLENLPPLSGRGADLGCGLGVLSLAVLESKGVSALALLDIDRRAIEAAKKNVNDARAQFLWQDVREASLSGLDFVVMNPPFHEAGHEDHGLGQAFVRKAAAMLKPGGKLWLTANRHLPYEAALTGLFAKVNKAADAEGYKIYEAVK